MSILKAAFTLCCLVSAASALVLYPEKTLRAPKRPPPPPPPTLAPYPYAAAGSPVPSVQRSEELPTPQNPIPTESLPQTSHPVPEQHSSPVPEQHSSPVPQQSHKIPVPPVFREEVRDNEGQFSLRFSNGEGTLVDETGRLFTTNDGWEYVIVKKGSYSYISPEGTPIAVSYEADDKGVQSKVSFSGK